jgi:hypothetical protein
MENLLNKNTVNLNYDDTVINEITVITKKTNGVSK